MYRLSTMRKEYTVLDVYVGIYIIALEGGLRAKGGGGGHSDRFFFAILECC